MRVTGYRQLPTKYLTSVIELYRKTCLTELNTVWTKTPKSHLPGLVSEDKWKSLIINSWLNGFNPLTYCIKLGMLAYLHNSLHISASTSTRHWLYCELCLQTSLYRILLYIIIVIIIIGPSRVHRYFYVKRKTFCSIHAKLKQTRNQLNPQTKIFINFPLTHQIWHFRLTPRHQSSTMLILHQLINYLSFHWSVGLWELLILKASQPIKHRTNKRTK